MIKFMLHYPRYGKVVFVLLVDLFLCIVSAIIAFALRLGYVSKLTSAEMVVALTSVVVALPCLAYFGIYRTTFRYMGWNLLVSFSRALLVYSVVIIFILMVVGAPGIPGTIGIIQPMILFLGLCGSRAAAHYWLGGRRLSGRNVKDRRNVLIYGAGSAGRQLASALDLDGSMTVVGFVDDDKSLQGSVLNGRRIHAPDRMSDIVQNLSVDDFLLAIPSVPRRRRNEILDEMRKTSATIRTLPGLVDLAKGRVTSGDLRELDVVELLGRDAIEPNRLLFEKCIVGKIVMVTGGGGSIGGEICRQALNSQPATLIIFDQSEFNLYNILQELQERQVNRENFITKLVPILGSVQDEVMMRETFNRWKPQTIYHAAAYKHVPLVEHNPIEGIKNNVFGTLNLVKLSKEFAVDNFVLISTDKAVRPTNIMGATKRIAEQILQGASEYRADTCFSMVRFGNVLGSSGSVVPLFKKQIQSGGPITITDIEMTRYFMTIPEAAQLVIQAGAMAVGGEVFVLDMGEPVKIIDLARRMVELSGLTLSDVNNQGGDIKLEVIGLRPGEKLYEELLIGNNPEATIHERIFKANEKYMKWSDFQAKLSNLSLYISQNDVRNIVRSISSMVPEYKSSNLN